MIELGYALSSEEHRPNDLLRYARMAEEHGFTFALISDHFHPWIDRQGESPFVWSVLGGIARATERLRVGTGVTCPTVRIHPAIIAQAAATTAAMMPGRFLLGLGTGENLNEHITGERWPSANVRSDMLLEAIEIIRELWTGQNVDYEGRFYRVEDARIYTLPDELPPIYIAASGQQSAKTAADVGDGLIATAPQDGLVGAFEEAGGASEPKYGQVTVCWAESEEQARKTAYEHWPTAALKGELATELPLPRHFEQAAQMVTEEDVAQQVVCGPEVKRHVDGIRKFADAGFDHVYVHQVGPDQEGFFRFYRETVMPELRDLLVERQRPAA